MDSELNRDLGISGKTPLVVRAELLLLRVLHSQLLAESVVAVVQCTQIPNLLSPPSSVNTAVTFLLQSGVPLPNQVLKYFDHTLIGVCS